MTIDTDLINVNLLPQELSRAQQSGRLGEAQREHDALTRAFLLGHQVRLALGRMI